MGFSLIILVSQYGKRRGISVGKQTDKEDGLFDWVNLVLNPPPEDPENPPAIKPIAWEADGGPRPITAYVQLNIPMDNDVGIPQESLINVETEEMTISNDADLLLSIQGFYDGSNEYLHELKESLGKHTVLDFLDTKGFVVRKVGKITTFHEILDEVTEKRWLLEVTFGYAWSTTDKPGYITNVEYDGEYLPPN
jgi:hypothetical protein